jgi:chromosome segregation ATPase
MLTKTSVQLDVFTFGHGSSVDIMGFHNQANQARGNVESAMKTMQASRTQLQQFQKRRQELTNREAAQKQIQDQLPGLDSNTQDLMTRSVALQKQLADLKDASSNMVVKVRDIQNKATLTTQLAFTKKEFASGLLDVCEAALIDLRLLQPVKKITDEISTGYTGNMPDDVKQQIDAVEAKRQTVGHNSIVALSI